MLKRLHIYFKEMYPLIPRLFVGLIMFFEIYFIILLNSSVTKFDIGIQEFIGSFTVFAFFLMLRIADDFKDYELDCKLFKERPLPSGRVKKKDLALCLTVTVTITAALNILFMNNIIFFAALFLYGALMSVWFFQKNKIQKSLPLALITHNPVQMVINIYIISFTCIKYGLPAFSLTTVLSAFTLYFPLLLWEISRKIKAPSQETEYVTYSKLFGYKRAVRFVVTVTIVDIITNILLIYKLNRISIAALLINVAWFVAESVRFTKDPEKFKYIGRVEAYTYIQETIMLLTVAAYLIFGRI